LTWKNQANKLLNDYILPQTYEYKNMHNWTNDLTASSRQIFLDNIVKFNTSKQDGKIVRVLEIGTYSGMSLINIVQRIPNSVGVGMDIWCNYNENGKIMYVEELKVYESALNNVRNAGLSERISFRRGMSSKVLCEMMQLGERYDFIYIDGSNLVLDCYGDILLSWNLLEPGGMMVINVGPSKTLESRNDVVNHFLKKYEGEYTLLSMGRRVFISRLININVYPNG
jgi:precorrin-6B methylase 2